MVKKQHLQYFPNEIYWTLQYSMGNFWSFLRKEDFQFTCLQLKGDEAWHDKKK